MMIDSDRLTAHFQNQITVVQIRTRVKSNFAYFCSQSTLWIQNGNCNSSEQYIKSYNGVKYHDRVYILCVSSFIL